MLFQGIIESPDIPAVDNHEIAGEGEALPLLRCLWLRLLTPLLAVTPKRGTLVEFLAGAQSSGLATSDSVLGGEAHWTSPAHTGGRVSQVFTSNTSPTTTTSFPFGLQQCCLLALHLDSTVTQPSRTTLGTTGTISTPGAIETTLS
jgi:hypothetical protein